MSSIKLRSMRYVMAATFRLSVWDVQAAQGRYTSACPQPYDFKRVPHSRRLAFLVSSPEEQARERSMLVRMDVPK